MLKTAEKINREIRLFQMPSLSMRIRSPELMDDLLVSTQELNTALRALSLLNTLSMSAYFITNAIIRLIGPPPHSIRILDLGSGRGDVLCSVTNRLQKRGYNIDAVGIDMNPKSVKLATLYAKERNSSARFETATAIDAVETYDYDIVISSLILHHFSEADIVTLFSSAKNRASIGIIMCDLERSLLGFALTWLATRAVSKSHILQHDGLLSVQSALTKQDFQELASRAGLVNCHFSRTFPFRIIISWEKRFNLM